MAQEWIRKQYTGGAPKTQLAADIGNTDTVINCLGLGGWPTGAVPFVATIDRDTVKEEKILVTRSGNQMTAAQRGYDNTQALSHSVGAVVEHTVDAHSMNQANHIANLMLGKGQLIGHNGTNPAAIVGPGPSPSTDDFVVMSDSSAGAGFSVKRPSPVVNAGSAPPPGNTRYGLYYDTVLKTLMVTPDGGATWTPAGGNIPVFLSLADRNVKLPDPDNGVMSFISDTGVELVQIYDGTIWKTIHARFSLPSLRDTNIPAPVDGDVVYITQDHVLQVYRINEWITISQKQTMNTTAPASPQIGDLWFEPMS
jgi:hypothetical protein